MRFAHRVVLAAVVAAAPGCLVGGEGTAHVLVRLDLGTLELPAEGLPGPRDADGLVHLDRVPAYVHVVVTGPGLEPPLVASWPAADPLTPRDVVRFALEVPVGPQRRFAFLAYVRRAGEVRVWSDDGTVVRDLLEGGASSDLAVTLHESGRGTIAGTLGGPGAASVTAVLVVDGHPALPGSAEGPGVAWPPAAVTAGAFEVGNLPVGRPLSFALRLADDSLVLSPSPAATLSTAGERRELEVLVP